MNASATLAPPLTPEARDWGFRELARRAGVAEVGPDGNGFESLGVECVYGRPEDARTDRPAIVVVPCDPGDWSRLIGAPERSLESVAASGAVPPGARSPFEEPLPIVLVGRGSPARSFARRSGAAVVFDADVVSSTLLFLTRWEETANPARDAHDRMPAEASIAFRQGFLHRPVIDEYALVLREWLKALLPGWTPAARRFEVKLSHDIDTVRPYRTLGGGIRTAAGDLLRRGAPKAAARALRLTAAQTVSPRSTSAYRGLRRLAALSRRYRLSSAFYVMAASQTRHDSGYDPGKRPIRNALRELEAQGFELGFHPSYRTVDDPSLLAEEKSRLDGVLGRTRYGGRQHFLRFRAPDTWRRWEALGLSYDSTLAFAGHEGFRCGTCHSYRPFDLESNREIQLREVPLVAMDSTLKKDRGLSPEEAVERVLALARRCRAVEGTFTLLWHNSSLDGEWEGWGEAYERVVEGLESLS